MNKEEIQKMFKENPIKTIKYGDIEIPVEYLEQTTVNVDGKKYIQLQKENQKYKEVIDKLQDILNTQLAFTSSYQLNYQNAISLIEQAKDILKEVE